MKPASWAEKKTPFWIKAAIDDLGRLQKWLFLLLEEARLRSSFVLLGDGKRWNPKQKLGIGLYMSEGKIVWKIFYNIDLKRE